MSSSVSSRSTTSPSTLASAWTKSTSPGLKLRGDVGVEPQHAERAPPPLDHDGQAAAGAVLGQYRGAAEAALGAPVGHDRRRPGQQRVPGLGAVPGGNQHVGSESRQPVGDPEGEGVALGEVLDHGANLEVQQLDARAHRLLHEVGGARSLQRVLAEPGDRRLLGGAALELGLGLLLLGDVGHDPVPAPDAVLGLAHQRVVAKPHRVAVAVQQAVFERGW